LINFEGLSLNARARLCDFGRNVTFRSKVRVGSFSNESEFGVATSVFALSSCFQIRGRSVVRPVRNLGNAGCPVLTFEGIGLDVIQPPKREPRIMRYKLTDFEWVAISPFLPNKPRGIPRVDDRRVLNGIF
jgi:hypothetical protein